MSLALSDIGGPLTSLVGKREISYRASDEAAAVEACGEIRRGMTMVGITKGTFSLLDLIEHVLGATGPADVDISTWTMGVYDADQLWRFAAHGHVKTIRFLLDQSFFGRRPELSEAFIAAFGAAAMRSLYNHAKFALIGNGEWNVAVVGSMNLNRNKRLESFVIIDDVATYKFYRAIVDRVFAQTTSVWAGERVARREFEMMSLCGKRAGGAERRILW